VEWPLDIVVSCEIITAGASCSMSVYFPADAGFHFTNSRGDGRLS